MFDEFRDSVVDDIEDSDDDREPAPATRNYSRTSRDPPSTIDVSDIKGIFDRIFVLVLTNQLGPALRTRRVKENDVFEFKDDDDDKRKDEKAECPLCSRSFSVHLIENHVNRVHFPVLCIHV